MDLGDLLWGMFAFFFWAMVIWMFIVIFGDIFRRDDMSGWAKAGWILLIFVLPFLGVLIYIIARPKGIDAGAGSMALYGQPRRPEYSAAEEVAKLAELRDAGNLTTEEYEAMKQRAVARV
jgi:Phospholipase_D-nuclease N-terminal